jgi:hypothetical protein
MRGSYGDVYGFNFKNVTPYPPSVTDNFCAGVMATAAGPLLALVFASIVIVVALENAPSADTSTITVRGSPAPLLSVDACTARSTIITTTDPSLFFVARISALDVSVTSSSKMSDPGELGVEGNICPNQ